MFKFVKFLVSFLIILIIFINNSLANENSAAVFLYHRFDENKYPSTNTRMSQFKKHIEELTNNNYNVIPINQMVDALINKKSLPKKSVVITMDDAFLSIYKKAWPILKKKKLPFTVFVSTNSLESPSKNYMNWDQIKEMAANGVTIGHHTKNHSILLIKIEIQ